MKIEFTPSGGSLVTLGDDSIKHTLRLEQLGGAALEQVTPLFRGANPKRFPRSNVQGQVIFTARKSHSTRAVAANFYKTEFGRIAQQGSLVVTIDATTLTFANAVLKEVTVVIPDGTSWTLRYVFGITTLT